MSRFNLSKSICLEGIFEDKPPKSFLEAGENSSIVAQGAAANYQYTRSSQRKKNEEMAFGDGMSVGTTAKPCAHSLRTPSDSSLEITLRLQQQVAKESQWVTKERRGIDDTTRGKDLSIVGEFIERPQNNKGICDTEIRVNKEVFRAHRVVLSCYSSYFLNLFSKGKYKLPIIIKMSGISSEAFRVFLNCVYDRVFNVNYDNVEEVIKVADALGIPFLKERCLKFLEHTSLEKAIKILRGNRHSPDSTMFKFLIFRVSEKFPKLYNNKGFLELDASTVCWILSDDNIQISKEMDVFVLGMKWIIHSRNERQKYLSEVMYCVRFLNMTQDELFECFEISDMLKNSVEVRNMILHSNWVLTAGAMKRKDPLQIPLSAPRNCLTETRQLTKKTSSAFFSAQALPDVRVNVELCSSPEFADKHHGQETAHSTVLPQSLYHHADALLDGKLYFFGGSVPKLANGVDVPTNVAYVFNCETRKWTPIKSMHTPRCHHATCALGGMLYVIGGEDNKSRVLRSVECYNPKTNAWFFVKSMMDPRLGASAAELDGKIIVAGGYGQSRRTTNTTENPVLRSVESYDPKLNSWRPKNDLRFPRCYSNLVNVQGKLYLCGGATSSFGTPVLTSVSSIDVYNKNHGVWEEKANLSVARHHAKCFVAGNGRRIYILGGVSTEADSILRSECHDVTKDVWVSR